MKILVIPDKFKGSLTASQVCDAVETGIQNILSNCQLTKIPLADGGEGSLEVLEKTIRFNRIYIKIKNPLFNIIWSYYGLLNDTAYIEMAKASGLQLLKENERNPNSTTSFGTGEMILDAIQNGAKKIYLFVGGSATNDAGIGLAAALGYSFIDKEGRMLEPIGANLINIEAIDDSNKHNLDGIEIIVLTDVNNPLFGNNGAAYIYAEQKGARKADIAKLDYGLRNFAKIVEQKFGFDVSNLPGSGAAGGIGAGAVAFCNAKIKSGIDTIMDLLNIKDHIEQNDIVITGEGLLDKQTLEGKVAKGVLDRCKILDKPLGIVCGDMDLSDIKRNEFNTTVLKPIRIKGMLKEEAINNAYSLLIKRAEEIIKEFGLKS